MIKDKKGKSELISVIIPAYNEEKSISSVIKDVLQLAKKYPLEIIVVNDGSKDKTSAVAKKAGVHKVFTHEKNKGKGAAFQTGLKNAKGNYIIQIDADGQLAASDIPKLIEPLKKGYDVVLGIRYDLKSPFKSDVSVLNTIGNLLLSFSAAVLIQRNIVDIMTGFKAFRREVALDINPTVNHFGYEAELVVKAAQKNYKIKNVLITVKKREVGVSNVKIVKHGVLVLKTIVKSAF